MDLLELSPRPRRTCPVVHTGSVRVLGGARRSAELFEAFLRIYLNCVPFDHQLRRGSDGSSVRVRVRVRVSGLG